MPINFCSQCGEKLQATFKFCPSCGEKLPCLPLAASPAPAGQTASRSDGTALDKSPVQAPKRKNQAVVSPTPAAATSLPPRRTRRLLYGEKEVKPNSDDVSVPGEPSSVTAAKDGVVLGDGLSESLSAALPAIKSCSVPATLKSPHSVRTRAKSTSPAIKQVNTDKTSRREDESAVGGAAAASPPAPSPPASSPSSRTPVKAGPKSKAKRAKLVSSVERLQEGEVVTDTTGKKWQLATVLSQTPTELVYEVFPAATQSRSSESKHILKLGAKDGRLFNVQNFLQRAAKPASVDKWIKQNRLDFLGIPSCLGFGLHAESYRFLVFADMGQSLQAIMEEENELLTEKTVLQLAYRILDVLLYIHSNEYVHADINAENLYVKPGKNSQVYLVGYCHAFRYCPEGKHVEYREASRTPHEGTVEFISLDTHKGAAPSRRGDLQALGYCLLRWHTGQLPWSGLTQPDKVAAEKERYMKDVPALLNHCFGSKSVSSAFKAYLTAVMSLQYSEQPDYSALKAGVSAALQQLKATPQQPLTF